MAFFALNASAKLGSLDKVKYAGDLEYKNFCEAVVKDDVNMLKRSVRNKVGLVASSSQAVLKKLTASNGIGYFFDRLLQLLGCKLLRIGTTVFVNLMPFLTSMRHH